MSKPKKVSAQLRNRVVERRRMRVGELLPNERNPRRHPQLQRDALTDVLHEVGQVGELYAYPSERAGGKLVLIDGHLRRDLNPDQEWDVAITDLSDTEAAKVLATYDPLAALAERDDAAWTALLADVETDSEALRAMLELPGVLEMPGDDEGQGGSSERAVLCPECGHSFVP